MMIAFWGGTSQFICIYNVCSLYYYIDTIYLNTMNVYTPYIYIYMYLGTQIYLKRPETHSVSASTMISFNHWIYLENRALYVQRRKQKWWDYVDCRPRSGAEKKQQANTDPTKEI